MTKIRVRLPVPWDGWEAKLRLKDWMDGKKTTYDEAHNFRIIDIAREVWLAQGLPDEADDPASIVSTTWPVFMKDEDMREYVLHTRNLDITELSDWTKVAETYAYLVLQRYNRKLDTK